MDFNGNFVFREQLGYFFFPVRRQCAVNESDRARSKFIVPRWHDNDLLNVERGGHSALNIFRMDVLASRDEHVVYPAAYDKF